MFSLKRRIDEPGGYRDVLRVSLPLVMSMASITLMQFTDRLFLGHYSLEAIAAATPAGILSFLFLSFFMGTGEYVSVFIAQYTGMGRPRRVGDAMWQGIWFALGSGALLAIGALLGPWLFSLAGHPPAVREMEEVYFRILMLGNGMVVLQAVLGCFYSGRGVTRPVMLVNLFGACVNIPLDYAMINGLHVAGLTILPEMGIAGAALATVISWAVMLAAFAWLVFRKKNEERFGMRSALGFDRELFGRLMRYGVPGGVHFFVDIFAVTFFIFMVGRLGTEALAATNVVFALNTIAFLPMIGFSIGVSVLVGQALGADDPDNAHRAAMNTLHMTLAYMALMAAVFLLLPGQLASWFRPADMSPAAYAPIRGVAVLLLRLVALYSFFDALAMIFYGALKGAGDTRFVMLAMVSLALGLIVVPVYVAIEVLHTGILPPWIMFTVYIVGLAMTLGYRYKNGAWRSMRVVGEWERTVASPPNT